GGSRGPAAAGRGGLRLRAELGSEAAFERLDHTGPESDGILVRERSVGRLEGDGEGDRLLPRRDRRIAIVAEEADLAQLRCRRPASRLEQLTGRDVRVDDEGALLSDDWVGDDVLVRDRLAAA